MTEAWHAFPEPGLVIQGDGSRFQWQNCAAATWAALVASDQHGKRPAKGSPWLPTGASIRAQSGDTSGGIMPSTLDAAVNRVYDIDLEVRIASRDAVQAALDDRRCVGILVRYGAIDDTPLSGSPGFRDNHSIPLFGSARRPDGSIDWLDGDPLYDGRRAGIPKGPQWMRRTVLIKAAGDLVLDDSGQTVRQRYGENHLYAVFGRHPYIAGTPGPTPAPLPGVVDSAPVTAAERAQPMIRGAWGVTSTKVQRLQPGQPLFAHPGGPRVTRIGTARPISVSHLGSLGPGWGMVLIRTGSPYADKQARPTALAVPLSAGPISNR